MAALLSLLSGCSIRGNAVIPNIKPEQLNDRPAIVFVHGYYGSALQEIETKDPVFLNLREALFGQGALSLFQEELATPKGPKVEVEGVLGQISVVPFFYRADIYSLLIDSLKTPAVQVVPYAYDWREDLGQAVAGLDALVAALRAKGVPKIAIVAHSMGGLVASYYLAYGKQPLASAVMNWDGAKQVNKAVLLGVPFRGVFSIFRNMQEGPPAFWSKRLLPAEAVASFPSSYHLIPFQSVHLPNVKGGETEMKLGEPRLWEQYSLGLLRNKEKSAEVARARLAFTQDQLARAALFSRKILNPEKSVPPPPHLRLVNVLGKGRPTVDKAFWDAEKNEFIFDTDNPKKKGLNGNALTVDGDGTVPVYSAEIPAAFAGFTKQLYSKETHDHIFADREVQEILRTIFSE